MVRSYPTEAMSPLPSGLMSAPITLPSCPANVFVSLKSDPAHSFMVLS